MAPRSQLEKDTGLMIDLHNHLLHGLDDGPRTIEESIRMCEISYKDGVRTIVATPHTLNGVYQNNRSTILARVEDLRLVLGESGFPADQQQHAAASEPTSSPTRPPSERL